MLKHFLTLGLDFNASDNEIRQNYLNLVRKHTPEQDPDKFHQITEAYEAVKDERSRINESLFGIFKINDVKSEINSIINAKQINRKRVGLKTLIRFSGN